MASESTTTVPTATAPDKKAPAAGNGGKNAIKRNASIPRPTSAAGSNSTSGGTARPSSRTGNKKSSASPTPDNAAADAKKGPNVRPDQRGKAQGQAGRGGGHRKAQSSATAPKQGAAPIPVPQSSAEGSDALQSLQRVITDLKSISPPTNAPTANPLSAITPQSVNSSLPHNAPVFQPGATAFPIANASSDPLRHRKAASLGTQGSPVYPSPLQQYQAHLSSFLEDVGENQGDFEEGEIPDGPSWQQQQNFSRPQGQQNFVPPRFAALAQQQQSNQEQQDVLGPSGRPQLAPNFMFGARRRGSAATAPMVPAIEEDVVGFQFPQQHTQQTFQPEPQAHRRNESGAGEITGIMAEQISLQNQIEALQQQQQQLYQQQLASSQAMATFSAPQLNPGRINAHRRVQSTIPMGMAQNNFAGFGALQPSNIGAFNLPPLANGGFNEQDGINRGHGRRHSVNVVNKSAVQGNQATFPFPGQLNQESYDDSVVPASFGGHSRTGSRVDSGWRMNNGGPVVSNNAGNFTDLAQAQAQLQSLQQFRAAAGGHHQKMPSFSFPNMLPNMMAANMMGLGGLNLLQQQQQFQLQLQQQSSQPQRKSLFAPYLPQASLPPLLAAGKLVVGILRVNKRNRSDAYVATEVLDADIYICGSKDRNRALEGDIVAVELLDVDEVWGTKKEKEEKKRKKEENAVYDPRSVNGRKNEKKKDDVEVEGQGLMLFEDEEVTDEVKPQFAGHVVAVVERMPGQLFSGTLGLLRPSSVATKEKQEAERREREGDRAVEERKGPIERPKIVWFKPTDKRVPLIAIPTEQAPPDFVQNSEAYADKLFVACIKRHPISSLHPFGTLVEELGIIGDIEVETSALLKDCNFPTEDFTENVLKCLPPLPWTIPDREFEVRRDMRRDRVFTIDPETARDLDDALSITYNDDGTYDVGVHIADVSYFVKPNTALDRDAKKRATSVYLVQRCVPMLPPALSEQLCSLLPGQDRLAFSVILTMTEDGRVLKKWFGRTVIRSAAKLSYSHAQAVIDGKSLGDVPVGPEHDASAIERDIKTLFGMADRMRTRRFNNGALTMNSRRLNFNLDETGFPTDCSQYDRDEAHYLIEEFMLLTNVVVAQHVAVSLPEQALLRRHEDPLERRVNAFAARAERLGYPMDTSSAGSIMKSLEAIPDQNARQIVELLFQRAVQRAKYFCAGMLDIAKYQHYALNAPLYTHFTSPIRRYADLIVHRQLESILLGSSAEPKFSMDRDTVAKIAQQCNIKKDSAKLAQEQSAHLYLCHLIADLTQKFGPVVRQAQVVGVLDAAFDVLVPEFGIEKRVHIDQMPIENSVYDEHTYTLSIYWSTRDVISWLAENSDDEHLKKVKQTAEQHAQKMEVASRSIHDESALFDEDEDDIVLSKEGVDKETSVQRLRSKANAKPVFEGLRTTESGHKIQDIKEMMTVPVIVTADLTKSPPVIKVYSVNPHSEKK
ncbi:RNB-domain-containing protein [Sistotremastrum niveocremeum HHB9708]|uniref:DIS3-like exonuclease 2 n=2 Tax=Sistotremastraceae TaxID=3402574 RepID=A0A164ZQR3_9AGAM|nr:RNB-domain-containing protein [Sistotremastrum niveocremeum HHB9708]KZT36829.1 RNB-domain-containing protein [Sistotremastrum suecicum HHB10207 ss-3]